MSPNQQIFDPQAIKNSDRVWIEEDILLWQAFEGGLDFGIKRDSSSSVRNGHVQSMDFDWDWGCRLGIGYKIPHDQWDLFLGYTYVHAHGRDRINGIAFPSSQAPFATLGTYVTHAEMQGHGNINIGDLELGRNCFAGNWLTIRPFLGVRGAVIDQQFKASYTGGDAVPSGDIYQNQLKNDFWGVGGRMGADTLWGLGRGFGIYGNGAFSFLGGQFHLSQVEHLKKAGHTFVNLKDNQGSLILTAEAALGVQWDHFFSRDRYHIGVKLGWEFNIFFDQNRLRRFVSSTSYRSVSNNNDLSFQGVTLGVRFDF